VVLAIADDMSDGVLDGHGPDAANLRIAALAKVVSAQVLIESSSNNLQVDGVTATDALDNAILTTRPTAAGAALTDNVAINQEMLVQARTTLDTARVLAPSIELTTLSEILNRIQPGSLPSEIEPVLPGDSSQDLEPAIDFTASATEEQLALINTTPSPDPGGTGDPIGSTNNPPSISGNPDASVDVGALYSFQPSASDPDGDTLSFSIVNAPDWATFDVVSGVLSGTPTDVDAGVYSEIVVSVSDGNASDSLPAFSITVNAGQTVENSAPVITGTPASNAQEDSSYVFQPSATDADGDSLVFGITNRPSWASFNTNTGRLSGTPVNADVGTYDGISITVSDGSASTSIGPFSITVNNTNDAPSISGAPATNVDEGSLYLFQPSANDPDGDSLTFSVQNRPAWASFDSSNGRLSGTPAAGDAGTYGNVVISVSDGSETVSLPAFGITVNSTVTDIYNLFLSTFPDRSGAVSLDGASVTDDIYVFTGPDTSVQMVEFFVDDIGAQGTAIKTENQAPYDLGGTSSTDTAFPFDTRNLTDGTHTLTAKLTLLDGSKQLVTASFTAVNGTPSSGQAGSVSLSWAAPVSRTDGSALTMGEIAGYTLYYGTTEGDYSNAVDINDANTTSATVSDLPVGTYYFVVTARDIAGLESGYSDVATKQAQ
jgi:hypothetical protein